VKDTKIPLQNRGLKIWKQNSEVHPHQCPHLTTMVVTDPSVIAMASPEGCPIILKLKQPNILVLTEVLLAS